MCEQCYEGLRVIDTPETRRVAELIRRVYQAENGASGAYLHIVVDDNNVEDGCIDFCLAEMDKNEYKDSPEDIAIQRECALALKALTEDERASAILFYDESVESFGRNLRALTVNE